MRPSHVRIVITLVLLLVFAGWAIPTAARRILGLALRDSLERFVFSIYLVLGSGNIGK
jgi:hypothetical protein